MWQTSILFLLLVQMSAIVNEGSEESLRKTRVFPQRPFGGRKLRFPPSNVRFAPCLPFSDSVLRPKGPSPLEPPLLCCRKSAKIRLLSGSALLSASREEPCPLRCGGLSEGLPLALPSTKKAAPLEKRLGKPEPSRPLFHSRILKLSNPHERGDAGRKFYGGYPGIRYVAPIFC